MYLALNDQYQPLNSQDNNSMYLHWWPKHNTQEWVQYDFDQEYTVSGSEVYWYDDSPFGDCRIPASWRILYKQGDQWLPVKNTTPYSVQKDKYDSVQFEPVKTSALRLEIQLPKENASGIHEWIVR
jgi:hypothetical protein